MSERPRGPGLVFGAATLVLIVLLAFFALTQRQPPPPTIAEFAPQAVENITDAPSDQSASSGTGDGDCAAGQSCGVGTGDGGGAAAAPEPIEVARVRKCVGEPPRQTEDPQSPPCVPYWAGDNGGATARGVTRDEIRIAAPNGLTDTTIGMNNTAFERFFNSRFELYGRKLRLIDTLSDHTNCTTADGQQKAAVAADEQRKVFASLPEWGCGSFL